MLVAQDYQLSLRVPPGISAPRFRQHGSRRGHFECHENLGTRIE
jgi:hypothetical protein